MAGFIFIRLGHSFRCRIKQSSFKTHPVEYCRIINLLLELTLDDLLVKRGFL